MRVTIYVTKAILYPVHIDTFFWVNHWAIDNTYN